MTSPLDYQASVQPIRRTIFSIAGMACGAALAVVLIFCSVVTLRFELIFADFGMRLPTLTVWLLELMRFLRATFLLPLLALPFIGGFVLPLLDRFLPAQHRTVWRGSVGLILMLIGVIAIAAVVVLGLFIPLVTLIQGMSGAKP